MKKSSPKMVLEIAVFLLAAVGLLSALLVGASGAIRADTSNGDYKVFMPSIFGDQPILAPATMVPGTSIPTVTATYTGTPTATATHTATATQTATSTATTTNTPTATNTSTATSTPTTTATASSTATASPTSTATNTPQATATATATGTPVSGAPAIELFDAYPRTVASGKSTELFWRVSGAVDSLQLSPDIGDVAGSDSVDSGVLTEDTQYSLVAAMGGDSDQKSVMVDVIEGSQIKFFDWDEPVTKQHNGFARVRPEENYDWTQPVDFTQGTIYFRVVINSQPVPQNMLLQFCIWQKFADEEDWREECDNKLTVAGTQGNVVTWSKELDKFSTNSDLPLDWTKPRFVAGMVFKNELGCRVTTLEVTKAPAVCFDEDGEFIPWGGENPDDWFPLDWHVTAFNIVEAGTQLPAE